MEQSLYEKLGGSYTKVGDYLLPNLMIDETEQRHIGKYGRLRKHPICSIPASIAFVIMIIGWRNQSRIRLISLPNDKFGSE